MSAKRISEKVGQSFVCKTTREENKQRGVPAPPQSVCTRNARLLCTVNAKNYVSTHRAVRTAQNATSVATPQAGREAGCPARGSSGSPTLLGRSETGHEGVRG